MIFLARSEIFWENFLVEMVHWAKFWGVCGGVDINLVEEKESDKMTANSKTNEQLENHTITYLIKDIPTKPYSVISKSAIIRHFHRLNPKLVVRSVQTFKISHQNQSVTIECKVAKRNTNPSDCVAQHGLMLPDVDEVKKLQKALACSETERITMTKLVRIRDDEVAKLRTRISKLEEALQWYIDANPGAPNKQAWAIEALKNDPN